MDQVVDLVQQLWFSVSAHLGGKATMLASLNMLGLIIMFFYLLVIDVQDTVLKAGAWLLVFLTVTLPGIFWPRFRTFSRPTQDLYGDRALSEDTHWVLIALGTYGLACTLIVAIFARGPSI